MKRWALLFLLLGVTPALGDDDYAISFGVLAKDDQPSLLTVSDIKQDFNTGASDLGL
jgi:hypothetical protein